MTNNNEQIKLLTWMLEDVRRVTLRGVEHLTKEQLFTPPLINEFPIGAYLMHLAEVDLGWLEDISQKSLSDEIKKRSYYDKWFDVPEPEPPIHAPEKEEYFDTIEITRKMFLDYITSLNDDELEDIITTIRGTKHRKLSKKWIIYHIIEHEAHTRGQMFMLIRKAGWNRK